MVRMVFRMPLMVGVLCITVLAKAQDNGVVNLNGRIVEAACTISTESQFQTVDMGVLPMSAVRQQGRGPVRPFVIRLMNCVLVSPSGQNRPIFTVTFDGADVTDMAGVFSVLGEASGVALRLHDSSGHVVYPGQPAARQLMIEGQSVLHYQLQLVSNAKPLHPGSYNSALRFRLDYD